MTAAIDELAKLEFRRSAKSLRKAVEQSNAEKFQAAVLRESRSALQRLEKRLTPTTSAALWSDSVLVVSDDDRKIASGLESSGKARRSIIRLIPDADIAAPVTPLVRFAALELLACEGKQLKADDFVRLYCLLARTASATSVGSADAPAATFGDDDEPPADLLAIISDAELPWLISVFLSDLKGQKEHRQQAARQLRAVLESSTDTDGLLHASLAINADQWLAPFVRATLWGGAFGESWSGRKTRRLADCVDHCVGLLIPGGLVCRPPTTRRDADERPAEILEHALRATGCKASSPYLRYVQAAARQKPKRENKKSRRSRNEDLNSQSDWAATGLMRTGLQADSDTILVQWPENTTSIHMAPLGTPLVSGTWDSRLTVDGRTIAVDAEWTCSCWFTDHEAAFLELESDPADSVHVVRHVMLSLEDRLAVVCESVTCTDDNAEIRCESCLPLVADPLAVTNSITRELVLHADCVSTRLVPAWLEDDRIQHTLGSCEKQKEGLVSIAEGVGGVTVPLVFDWHPERQALDADWSRLTVTEDRRRMSGREASGFRVRIGKQQLFIYRSLVPGEAPRAVLGLHTTNETVYGHVRKSGEIVALVMVDSELEQDD